MAWLWWAWGAGTVLFGALVVAAGIATGEGWLGALIDGRGRYSLSRLQLVLWMLVILPLIAAVFTGRLTVSGLDPFDFTIPAAVLGVLGISVGSTVVASAVKAHKNNVRPDMIAASEPGGAELVQLVLVEEGPDADRAIDLAKVQQLAITVILVAAYAASTIHTFLGHGPGAPVSGPGDIDSLPDFDSTFLLLLGVSHAGYLAGKVPDRGVSGVAADQPGYTLAERRRHAEQIPRMDRKRFRTWRKQARKEQRVAARNAAVTGGPSPDGSSTNGDLSWLGRGQ